MTRTGSLLLSINKEQSATDYSKAIQDKVAEVHFDWKNAEEVLGVLRDEVNELEDALIQNESLDKLEDELGDIAFTCVNLARHLGTTLDQALQRANQKFVSRFQKMEQLLFEDHLQINQLNFEELLSYWQQAKKELNNHE